MAYIGNPPAEAYTTTVKDSFSGNGSTVAFTLSRPSLTNDVRVVVENVIQDPTVAYSVSGTTLTFTSAPPSGTDNIYVVHLGPAVQTTVPPGEISAATTFASNVTVQGAFTSRGIDDNATSTAMTLDTSGNLLVGKTSTTNLLTTAGHVFYGNGEAFLTRAGTPLFLGRTGSDGNIANFYKDGTLVGGIGTSGGDLLIYSSEASHGGLRFGQGYTFPVNNTGATSDGAIDLGLSVGRFKDLYLSGGVYLGGTGSANLLDDYEEGTFTPTFVSSGGGESVTYDDQSGFYTKIGDRVLFNLSLGTAAVSGGSGYIQVHGLPFTVRGSVGGFGIVISLAYNFASTITGGSTGAVAGSTTRMDLYKNDNNANVWAWSTLATGSSSNRLWISGHYLTT
jgi:hypothetical protein